MESIYDKRIMQFYNNTYYHLYNRTNNEEALFRSEENYLYFLKKYRFYLDDYLETIGYCLMPTHFHFLVRVREIDGLHLGGGVHQKDYDGGKDGLHLGGGVHLLSREISDKIGILLSSYTKAINKSYNRHGSLLQEHTKAKPIPSDKYLINLLTYIHQNPLRSGLVAKADEWLYSSYQDYINLRNGTLPSKELILGMIKKEELKELTEKRIFDMIDVRIDVPHI